MILVPETQLESRRRAEVSERSTRTREGRKRKFHVCPDATKDAKQTPFTAFWRSESAKTMMGAFGKREAREE